MAAVVGNRVATHPSRWPALTVAVTPSCGFLLAGSGWPLRAVVCVMPPRGVDTGQEASGMLNVMMVGRGRLADVLPHEAITSGVLLAVTPGSWPQAPCPSTAASTRVCVGRVGVSAPTEEEAGVASWWCFMQHTIKSHLKNVQFDKFRHVYTPAKPSPQLTRILPPPGVSSCPLGVSVPHPPPPRTPEPLLLCA